MLPTSYPSIKDQRSSRYTEDAVPSTSRSRSQEEFERQKRREEWKRQQELEMEHKRKKKQKIMEYERKRAHLLGLSPSRRCLSDSPPHTRSSPNQYLSTRKEKSNGERPLFKGPEGTPISSQELRRIKVDIRRLNISVKGPIPDIQRDIPNLDDVFIWRKYGEGTKPIFDRPEIKQRHGDNVIEDNGEKEHCTIMTIKDQSASTNKAQTSRKRSSSPSPSAIYYIYRDKSSSHSYTYSRSFTEDKYRYDRYRERSRERSRERRDIERDRNRDRGRDRYRDRGRDRDRDRDRDRNRDRNRDRDRYIERRDVENYIGPLQLYPDSLAFNSSRPIIPITDLMVPPIRGFARLPAPIREFARPSAPIRLPYLYPPMYKMNVPNLTHVPESTQWMHPEARPFTQRLSNN